MAGLIVYLML